MPNAQELDKKYADGVAAARWKLTAAINPDSPDALDDEGILRLNDFLLVVRNNESNNLTPVEYGLVAMVRGYCHSCTHQDEGFTPDNMLRYIEGPDGCRARFEDAVFIARKFRTRYKAILDEADPEEEKEEEE